MKWLGALTGSLLIVFGVGGILSGYAYEISEVLDEYEEAVSEYQRLQCVRRMVLTGVPPDQTIQVSESGEYWYQRLVELLVPQRDVIDPAERDDVDVDVVLRLDFASDARCDGVEIRLSEP